MELDYFAPWQYALLVAGFSAIFTGIVWYEYSKKINTALFILLAGAFLLRLFSLFLDPFLNLWDEQFHALVAKNMMEHPFKPMLISKPWLEYDFRGWTSNHVWLHKQPLFLWQMALSMKIFGVNEFAVRLPSLIMMTIAAFFTFRIGKLLIGEREGLFAAALFATLNYSHRLSSGLEHTDHNDIAFLFYVTASIWAWIEYVHCTDKTKLLKWALLTGLFAGMAVLNKWLTGLLVFSGWFFYLLINKEYRTDKQKLQHFFLAAFISVLVFLPWQIYIGIAFPVESAYEREFSTRHFFEIIEGHKGGNWYHVEMLSLLYGYIAVYIFVPALIFFYSRSKNKKAAGAILLNIILLFLFFTVAATKMPAFTFPLAALFSIAFASLAYQAFDFIYSGTNKSGFLRLLMILVLLFLSFLNMDTKNIESQHGINSRNQVDNYFAIHRTKAKQFYVSLRERLTDKEYVVFNLPQFESVHAMFYLPYTCYESLPDYQTLTKLKRKGVTVAVFKNDTLPSAIENDKEIVKLIPLENDIIKQQKVYIKAVNNKYLSEDQKTGKLVANRELPGDWETFNLIQFRDSSFCIQTFIGRFLSARLNDGHKVDANSRNVQEWEHFTIKWLTDKEAAILSCDRKFMCVQPDGNLMVNKDTLTNTCRFVIEFKNAETTVFQ
jgi:4-amino-4-deoxy-L-arabinose transferase-like glycosyltransferase